MIILGIDPGTARTGWGVIRKAKGKGQRAKVGVGEGGVEYIGHGCIVTQKEMEMERRLLLLHRELRKLLREYKPEVICVERIFFGANAATAMMVGQARGVILLTAAETKTPSFEYQGLSVKRMLTGNGRSDKKAVQRRVREFLNISKRKLPFSAKDRGWDDASDALAIAIHHALKIS